MAARVKEEASGREDGEPALMDKWERWPVPELS